MPGQGSPKTLLDANNVHDSIPSQMVIAIDDEPARDSQLRSFMARLGQSTSPDTKRP